MADYAKRLMAEPMKDVEIRDVPVVSSVQLDGIVSVQAHTGPYNTGNAYTLPGADENFDTCQRS